MWDTIGSQSKTYSTHVFAWAGHNVKYRDVSKLGVQNSMTSFVDFDGPFWAFTQPYQLTNIRQFVAATRKALKRNVKVQTGRYFVNSSKRIKITLKQSSWAYNQPWIEKCNMWLKDANPTNVDCSRAWNALTIIPANNHIHMQSYKSLLKQAIRLSLSNQYSADESLKDTLPSLCPNRKVAGDMML